MQEMKSLKLFFPFPEKKTQKQPNLTYHIISENSVQLILVEGGHPFQTVNLMRLEFAVAAQTLGLP